jgi:hypothetical protein
MTRWSSLTHELDCWSKAGEVATFWWRDDDARSDTEQLDRFLDCTKSVPVALAVVPALADRSLAAKLQRRPFVFVLQHGWRHTNNAPAGLSEYPAGRDNIEVAEEFSAGQYILSDLFGAQSLPVFAPPWHGLDSGYLTLLRSCGIKAISTKGPRSAETISGLLQVNVHCAPILWTSPPSYGSDAEYVDAVLGHLRGRRLGTYDLAEPTGVLTHHRHQNARSYEFISRLISVVTDHPAAVWLSAPDAFGLSH